MERDLARLGSEGEAWADRRRKIRVEIEGLKEK